MLNEHKENTLLGLTFETNLNLKNMKKLLLIPCAILISGIVCAQNTLPTSGNVGIGTISPNKLLDVNGKSIFRDKATFEGVLKYNFYKDTSLTNDRILTITPSGRLRPLRTAFCDSMMVAKTVKVGDSSVWIGEEGGENAIWTTHGPLMLNANPGMYNEDIVLAYSSSVNKVYVGGHSMSSIEIMDPNYIGSLDGSKLNVFTPTLVAISGGTNNTEGTAFCSAVTSSNANFFVGKLYDQNPPSEMFFIRGSGEIQTLGNVITGSITSPSLGYNFTSYSHPNSPSGFYTTSASTSGYAFKSEYIVGGVTYGVTIGNQGNVEINPQAGGLKLKQGELRVEDGDTYLDGKLFVDDDVFVDGADVEVHNGVLTLYSTSSSSKQKVLSIQQNSTENFTVTHDGYLYAREIEVKTGSFPDYVFEEDYNLMPIDELKKYIEENGHLPGAPTAEEVIQENMKLKEMNLLLMEKVEELTLYMIELNEKIEAK